jgi:hypothetical protein
MRFLTRFPDSGYLSGKGKDLTGTCVRDRSGNPFLRHEKKIVVESPAEGNALKQ